MYAQAFPNQFFCNHLPHVVGYEENDILYILNAKEQSFDQIEGSKKQQDQSSQFGGFHFGNCADASKLLQQSKLDIQALENFAQENDDLLNDMKQQGKEVAIYRGATCFAEKVGSFTTEAPVLS